MTSADHRYLGGVLAAALVLGACSSNPEQPANDGAAQSGGLAERLGIPACDNRRLTDHEALLVLAPHPDDEILGFGGLTDAFLRAGKPVRTLVVTDGDAYCEACALWTSGSVTGPTCSAEQLSNFATPEIDSFAEARRLESQSAALIMGAPPPEFLGYPDTGIAFARAYRNAGMATEPLRRSDFSTCQACGDCGEGYGGGPRTELSASTLEASIERALEQAGEGALVATTHWLDGHPDHAALGTFVRQVNDRMASPRTIAFAVIHAHTPKDQAHADCWYPAPTAASCACSSEPGLQADPARVTALRDARRNPEWPQRLPDDRDYGRPVQLCLPDELANFPGGAKHEAIEAFATQLGTTSLRPGAVPGSGAGVMDCSGYLGAFGRRTEVFVLSRP
jgi:LmbE family N-acetylglucosaminyl deacetylase